MEEARFRLEEGVRERNCWEREEDKKCKMCEVEEET